MRELVLTCALALLGSGCVEVVSHFDEFDAGNPDVKISDAAMEPEAPTGQCASGERWMGTAASPLHYPGRSCLASNCHAPGSKAPFTIAGTIYPVIPVKGDHDDDDCNGINSSMMGTAVSILDESGAMEQFARLQVNNAGNFYSTKTVNMPFKVKVISQGREIAQMSTVTDGNCNSCHSKDGVAGAKGRIIPAAP